MLILKVHHQMKNYLKIEAIVKILSPTLEYLFFGLKDKFCLEI